MNGSATKHWIEPFTVWMEARGFLAGWNGRYVEITTTSEQLFDLAAIEAAVDEYNRGPPPGADAGNHRKR